MAGTLHGTGSKNSPSLLPCKSMYREVCGMQKCLHCLHVKNCPGSAALHVGPPVKWIMTVYCAEVSSASCLANRIQSRHTYPSRPHSRSFLLRPLPRVTHVAARGAWDSDTTSSVSLSVSVPRHNIPHPLIKMILQSGLPVPAGSRGEFTHPRPKRK